MLPSTPDPEPFLNNQFAVSNPRFIGPSPWSQQARNPKVASGHRETESPGWMAVVKTNIGSLVIGVLRLLQISALWLLRIDAVTLLKIAGLISPFLFVMSTSLKPVKCYIAQSPLYPTVQAFCNLDQFMFVPKFTHFCNLLILPPGDTSCDKDEPSQPVFYVVKDLNLLSRRNYASRGGGALIIPHFTSNTHGLTTCTGSRLTQAICNWENNYHVNPPEVVLEANINEGECWEFTGERGQIGINLTERATISHVMIGHPPLHLLSRDSGLRAPKRIGVWALTKGDEDLPQGFNGTFLSEERFHTRPQPGKRFWFWSPAKPVHHNFFIKVAEVQYEFSNTSSPPLLYPLDQAVQAQAIVLDIENPGGSTTCFYWIGVYGD